MAKSDLVRDLGRLLASAGGIIERLTEAERNEYQQRLDEMTRPRPFIMGSTDESYPNIVVGADSAAPIVLGSLPVYELEPHEEIEPVEIKPLHCAYCGSLWREAIFHPGRCGACGAPGG